MIQFLRFAAVGLSGTAVQYLTVQLSVMWSWSVFDKAPAVFGSALGYVLASIVNYILNYFLTFSSEKSHLEAASKYFTVLAIGWCLNLGLMSFFVEHLHWWHWYAQLITTAIGLCWNFGGSKLWAFRE